MSDHRGRKNPQSAEEWVEGKKEANDTPERKQAQLRYRLDSIEESVKRGRQQFEKVEVDVKQLRSLLNEA